MIPPWGSGPHRLGFCCRSLFPQPRGPRDRHPPPPPPPPEASRCRPFTSSDYQKGAKEPANTNKIGHVKIVKGAHSLPQSLPQGLPCCDQLASGVGGLIKLPHCGKRSLFHPEGVGTPRTPPHCSLDLTASQLLRPQRVLGASHPSAYRIRGGERTSFHQSLLWAVSLLMVNLGWRRESGWGETEQRNIPCVNWNNCLGEPLGTIS